MIELFFRDFSQILSFSSKLPLNFTSIFFWVLFGISLVLYALVYKKTALRNAFLFFISLFFYYKTSGVFFVLLIFSTLVDFLIGHGLNRTSSIWKRQIWVATSVIVNLSVLSYFKYPYFISDFLSEGFNINWDPLPVHAI